MGWNQRTKKLVSFLFYIFISFLNWRTETSAFYVCVYIKLNISLIFIHLSSLVSDLLSALLMLRKPKLIAWTRVGWLPGALIEISLRQLFLHMLISCKGPIIVFICDVFLLMNNEFCFMKILMMVVHRYFKFSNLNRKDYIFVRHSSSLFIYLFLELRAM